MSTIVIRAIGLPGPQGSKRYVGKSKKGKAIMVESSDKVKPWRESVKASAIAVMAGASPLAGPLLVTMVFTMPKPQSAPKRTQTWPCRMPDLSKLARSTEDALTDAGVWLDDAQVVEYLRLAKVYPGESEDSLHCPGVVIRIRPLRTEAAVRGV